MCETGIHPKNFHDFMQQAQYPPNKSLLKVNNKSTIKKYEICQKFTPFSSVSFGNFEQVNICLLNAINANIS